MENLSDRETWTELETFTEFVPAPECTLCTVLFWTLTELDVLTCRFVLVTTTRFAATCVASFTFVVDV